MWVDSMKGVQKESLKASLAHSIEHAKYVNQSELTQQVINHLGGYTGETKYVDLPKEKQNELYHLLAQIL